MLLIATVNSRNGYQSLGSLSNDDGDGKENGKKAIRKESGL